MKFIESWKKVKKNLWECVKDHTFPVWHTKLVFNEKKKVNNQGSVTAPEEGIRFSLTHSNYLPEDFLEK